MSRQVYQSSARVVFVQGENLQDVQILIDNEDLYNHLPGKFERHGVKTLSNWPFFVTAILNEQPQAMSEYALERHQAEMLVRDAVTADQLPIFDLTAPSKPTGTKAKKHKVEQTLSEIRKLHEDLNAALYARPTERPSIHNPTDAYNILLPFMGCLEHEELWVLNLDTRNRVMNLVKLYQGSVNTSQVRVSEIFRQAIIDNAPSIIISHNHPSGDANPSPEDIAVTRSIAQAGKLLDIEVLDHLVISLSKFVSLKERGLGFG